MPRALVRVVGSDSGALSLTAVQAAVTKKTKAASAFAFASFATASFEEVERTEGVRLEAVEGSGGRDLAAVLEAAE